MELKDDFNFKELQITEEARVSLYTTAKWSRFLALVIFAAILLFVLVVLYAMGTNFSGPFGRMLDTLFLYRSGNFVSYATGLIIWILLFGILGFVLLNFGNKTKYALNSENIEILNAGLKSLKVSFILYAIVSTFALISTLFFLFAYTKLLF